MSFNQTSQKSFETSRNRVLPSLPQARRVANQRLYVSALSIERRCSCAEVQILSGVGWIFILAKALILGLIHLSICRPPEEILRIFPSRPLAGPVFPLNF